MTRKHEVSDIAKDVQNKVSKFTVKNQTDGFMGILINVLLQENAAIHIVYASND